MSRISDIRQKEIINMTDGKRLGFASDMEINMESGKIEAVILPATGKIFGFLGKESDFIIPWENVKKIGADIILVEIDEKTLQKLM